MSTDRSAAGARAKGNAGAWRAAQLRAERNALRDAYDFSDESDVEADEGNWIQQHYENDSDVWAISTANASKVPSKK